MKKWTAALVAAFVFGAGLSVPAQAAPTIAPFKKYASCKALWKQYPWGVAEDRLAVRIAMEDGLARPDVNKKVYVANWRKMDKDRNGVICERVTRQQAEEYIGNLFQEAMCEKARLEGSPLGPECAKFGYGIR